MASWGCTYTHSELTVRRAHQNIRRLCIQTVLTGRPSVTEVSRRAVHQFAELLSARALRMACFHLRVCMTVCGTTRSISALCRHLQHSISFLGRCCMGCKQVLCRQNSASQRIFQLLWGTIRTFLAYSWHLREGSLAALTRIDTTMHRGSHHEGLALCSDGQYVSTT